LVEWIFKPSIFYQFLSFYQTKKTCVEWQVFQYVLFTYTITFQFQNNSGLRGYGRYKLCEIIVLIKSGCKVNYFLRFIKEVFSKSMTFVIFSGKSKYNNLYQIILALMAFPINAPYVPDISVVGTDKSTFGCVGK